MTTLTSPTSKRNKVVNTYIDYISLDINSGEAFSKIKVKIEFEENFDLFEESIEVGHSIKLTIKDDNIDTLINTLLFIENRI